MCLCTYVHAVVLLCIDTSSNTHRLSCFTSFLHSGHEYSSPVSTPKGREIQTTTSHEEKVMLNKKNNATPS